MRSSWRIEGYAGRGTYGVVYRARRAAHPGSAPVALKIGLFAYDPRFLREVELLSRAQHSSVPELLDHGWWHTDEGRGHPYLVMEWVNGLTLYEWARVHPPSCRQIFQVLAQVAGALDESLTAPTPAKVKVEVPAVVPAQCSGKAVAAPPPARAEPQSGLRWICFKLGLSVGTTVLAIAASGWMGQMVNGEHRQLVRFEEPEAEAARDAGPASLADASVTTEVSSQESLPPAAIALEMPEKPLPRQRVPPCRRGEVALRGGCWAPWITLTPPCGSDAYEWQGACYWPLYESSRSRTSNEPQ